jgi:hypothetical protein
MSSALTASLNNPYKNPNHENMWRHILHTDRFRFTSNLWRSHALQIHDQDLWLQQLTVAGGVIGHAGGGGFTGDREG